MDKSLHLRCYYPANLKSLPLYTSTNMIHHVERLYASAFGRDCLLGNQKECNLCMKVLREKQRRLSRANHLLQRRITYYQPKSLGQFLIKYNHHRHHLLKESLPRLFSYGVIPRLVPLHACVVSASLALENFSTNMVNAVLDMSMWTNESLEILSNPHLFFLNQSIINGNNPQRRQRHQQRHHWSLWLRSQQPLPLLFNILLRDVHGLVTIFERNSRLAYTRRRRQKQSLETTTTTTTTTTTASKTSPFPRQISSARLLLRTKMSFLVVVPSISLKRQNLLNYFYINSIHMNKSRDILPRGHSKEKKNKP